MDKLRRYWDYAAERAAKTVAQTALATIGGVVCPIDPAEAEMCESCQ